jgi:two-component system NtrC family sensor kinase
LINLANVIDEPRMPVPPTPVFLSEELAKLERASAAFVDLGYFDSSGVQSAYAGPYSSLAHRSYASESWFLDLKEGESDFVITDIYLGFRNIPHFTIALSRMVDGQFLVLRATLTPEKMYEYISSFEGSHEVLISIVNQDGLYQLGTPRLGTPLESSSFVPTEDPRVGASQVEVGGDSLTYAYSWLDQADWALIVQPAPGIDQGFLAGLRFRIVAVAAVVFVLSLGVIFHRAGKVVDFHIESERNRMQLTQAAKLMSVGELAAGIAHEINNPLAAIGAEAGLVKDLMSSEFGEPTKPEELVTHLDSIQELVLRCRDITHKLLKFVRKTDVQLKKENVHALIDEVVDDLLGNEIMLANVRVERNYDPDVSHILTDGHQLQQVVLNIVNNAIDAMTDGPRRLSISTESSKGNLRILISDTGKGMTAEQLDKVFLPFFTTKKVGEGTGLGMSVSYGIVKSLGGDIEAESEIARGTTFTIILPERRGSVLARTAS